MNPQQSQTKLKTIFVLLSMLFSGIFLTRAQNDTLHLYFKGQQAKAADTTEAKIAAWAKTLNGKKVNVDIIAYYDISDLKPLANERKEETFLSVMRKARDVVSIEKTEIKKGSKSQRFTVDIIYRSPETIVTKEKTVDDAKPKQTKSDAKNEKQKETSNPKDKQDLAAEKKKEPVKNEKKQKEEKETVKAEKTEKKEKKGDKKTETKPAIEPLVEVKPFSGNNMSVEWLSITNENYIRAAKWEPVTTDKYVFFLELMMADPNQMNVIRLDKSNLGNQQIKPIVLNLKGEKKEIVSRELFAVDNDLVLLCTVHNSESKKLSLYGYSISQSLDFNSNPVLVDEITYTSKKVNGEFNIYNSEDHDKLVIIKKTPEALNEKLVLQTKVIGKSIDIIHDKSFELPFKALNPKKKAYESTPDLLVKFKKDKLFLFGIDLVDENEIEPDPIYKEAIVTCDYATDKITATDVDVNGLGFHDVDMTFNKAGQLMLYGLYTETKVKDNKNYFEAGTIGGQISQGAFVYTLGADGSKFASNSIRPFGDKYLNYRVIDINEFSDGSIGFTCMKIITFIRNYKNKHNVLNPSSFLYPEGKILRERINEYKNILVFNANAPDANLWMKVFKIDQVSKEDLNSAFGIRVGKGNTKDNDGFFIHSIQTINSNDKINILVNNKKDRVPEQKENEIDLGNLKDSNPFTRVFTFTAKGEYSTFDLSDKFENSFPVLLTNEVGLKSRNKLITRFVTDQGFGKPRAAIISFN